ncbi:hypothetical protein CFELI_08790 [Corynebacterium felinum]|nr:hypothetical protein CFELI_08790 [Corynebacterium felinum]
MILPHDIQAQLERYTRKHYLDILSADSFYRSYPLHPPTAAEAFAHKEHTATWINQWQKVSWAEIDYATKNWRQAGLGTQTVPVRATISSKQQLYHALTQQTVAHLNDLGTKLEIVANAIGHQRARETVKAWEKLTIDDIHRGLALRDWLEHNPNSGLLPRAVPIRGMDTKWLEHNLPLIRALTGIDDTGLAHPQTTIHLRVLDPTIRLHPLICSMGLDPAEISPALDHARVIIMVENKLTFQALPDYPATGAVAVWGEGYRAEKLVQIPEIQSLPVLYFGDLDHDGFAILSNIRRMHPNVTSFAMDSATLDLFREFAIEDRNYQPRSYQHLTQEESRTLDALLAANLRLEQERISFDHVLTHLQALLHNHQSQ